MTTKLAPPPMPPAMVALPHWLLWRLEDKPDQPKPAKVPYSPNTLSKCDPTNIASLGSYDKALYGWQAAPARYNGLGFSLQGGMVCVDLDDCLDESGQPFLWTQKILEQLPPSYTEVSQSGRGLHYFCKGGIEGTHSKFKVDGIHTVEIYHHKRYIAVTGNRFNDSPLTLADATSELQALYTQLLEKQPSPPVTQVPKGEQTPSQPLPFSDSNLIQRMFSATNGQAIERLWHGDTSAYGDDDSSADLALLSHLAWWTNGDAHQMERLFSQSMLGSRDKWHQRGDYRERTITKALEGFTEGYTGTIRHGDIASLHNKPSQPDDWPAPRPLPRALLPVKPFDVDLLPHRVRAFVEDEAHRMQAPIDFLAISIMVVLASAIGRQMTIRPKQHDDWAVVPNLWGMVIGRPSTLKTPSIAAVMKALKKLEDKERASYEEEMKDYKALAEVAKIRADERKSDLKKKFKKGGEVDMTQAAKDWREGTELPPEPVWKRYLTNDSTIEKVGELLANNSQGMMVFRDELAGFLKRLDKDGHEEDRTFYLESWNGDASFNTDRIMRGSIVIPGLCLSVFGGIQPSVVSKWLYGMMTQIGQDDGLIQRFQLMVWPDEPAIYKNVDVPPNLTARQGYYDLLASLVAIDPVSVGATVSEDNNDLPYLRFADDAQPLFSQWMTDWRNNLKGAGYDSPLENHYGKYSSLVASLALICHLANGDKGAVTKAALLQALAWCDYLQTHATRIYTAALDAHVDVAHTVLSKVEKGKLPNTFTVRELKRHHCRSTPTDQLHEALAELEDYGYLRREVQRTQGRHKELFHLHPQYQRTEEVAHG